MNLTCKNKSFQSDSSVIDKISLSNFETFTTKAEQCDSSQTEQPNYLLNLSTTHSLHPKTSITTKHNYKPIEQTDSNFESHRNTSHLIMQQYHNSTQYVKYPKYSFSDNE